MYKSKNSASKKVYGLVLTQLNFLLICAFILSIDADGEPLKKNFDSYILKLH